VVVVIKLLVALVAVEETASVTVGWERLGRDSTAVKRLVAVLVLRAVVEQVQLQIQR
jgi:hypothetical protein